ncbi:MAG TPA: isoprenylcysteine carboxylmethyltransferase family protein [Gemmatimonadales bacterium]|nr:isoprenylcysteine carboxylmethyltransferase family protein [Gemmatimonadales bacterium]
MRPLPFVWPYAPVFWVAFAWAFWPEFRIVRRAQRSADVKDARSLQVILFAQGGASLAAWPLAWVRALQFPWPQGGVFFAGVAILIAGSLLRRHCWRMLGSSFTGDVRASAEQAIVTRGAYSILRHPAYTAGILMNTGFGIALGSWASAGVLAVATTAGYLYRIAVEERALVGALGEPYREFMRTRKRLIPFVY